MRRYQIAFLIALAFALLLGGAAGYLWFHPRPMPHLTEAPAASSPPPPQASMAAPAQLSESAEPKLLPVQLTPQRMQSIGVKTGLVEFKVLHDEMRTTGSVEVDETRLAWVQV